MMTFIILFLLYVEFYVDNIDTFIDGEAVSLTLLHTTSLHIGLTVVIELLVDKRAINHFFY